MPYRRWGWRTKTNLTEGERRDRTWKVAVWFQASLTAITFFSYLNLCLLLTSRQTSAVMIWPASKFKQYSVCSKVNSSWGKINVTWLLVALNFNSYWSLHLFLGFRRGFLSLSAKTKNNEKSRKIRNFLTSNLTLCTFARQHQPCRGYRKWKTVWMPAGIYSSWTARQWKTCLDPGSLPCHRTSGLVGNMS